MSCINDILTIEVLTCKRAYRDVQQNKNTLIFYIYRGPSREQQFEWIGQLDDNIHNFYALRSNQSVHCYSEEASQKLITAVVVNSYEDAALTERGYKNLVRVSREIYR
ncbi:hypothetical protein [Thalassotalea piscium]|uniref:Uncharacterized protein n=1 Tax=Thalassotalea piscium TaxID=1230533 RepID=A0A7X0NED1_9GAMM|nr:hypothetical protein [Thalassotalea piscium]MBB6541900.1 hypothetical protein [Thalassotalea piscium]